MLTKHLFMELLKSLNCLKNIYVILINILINLFAVLYINKNKIFDSILITKFLNLNFVKLIFLLNTNKYFRLLSKFKIN